MAEARALVRQRNVDTATAPFEAIERPISQRPVVWVSLFAVIACSAVILSMSGPKDPTDSANLKPNTSTSPDSKQPMPSKTTEGNSTPRKSSSSDVETKNDVSMTLRDSFGKDGVRKKS